MRATLIWVALMLAMAVPVIIAAGSPLLAWRDPVYIVAGFAGVIGMALILLQPLLAADLLPTPSAATGRRWHRIFGTILLISVIIHIAGLWITSPPDVIDVLLVRSPTPFAVWGLLAMYAVFAAALLALFRRRLPLRLWRWGHTLAVSLVVIGTVLHAVQIDGTMGQLSKWMLAALVLIAFGMAILRRRVWAIGLRRR